MTSYLCLHIKMENENSFQNLFDDFQKNYGVACFGNEEIVNKIKRSLHRLLGMYGNYRVVVQKVVNSALDFYIRKSRDLEGLPECFHDEVSLVGVLALALHLCEHFRIMDQSDLVKDKMKKLFNEDDGFDRFCLFLDPLVFPYEIDTVLFPQPMGQVQTMVPRYLKVLEYFLSQAHNLAITIQFSELDLTQNNLPYHTYGCDVRFVDAPLPGSRGSTPLLLACHAINPAAVLLLLRYGADPLRSGQLHRVIGLQFQHPLYVLLTKLNASVFWLSHHQHLDVTLKEQFMKTHNRQVNDIRQCLRYFCRAAVNLPIGISGEGSTVRDNIGKVFYLHPAQQDAVPVTRTKEPAELCHQARCLIRQHLHQHSNLDQPSSIQKLPLPTLIKRYLDLLID